jgi:hypothetical protein
MMVMKKKKQPTKTGRKIPNARIPAIFLIKPITRLATVFRHLQPFLGTESGFECFLGRYLVWDGGQNPLYLQRQVFLLFLSHFAVIGLLA